MQNRKVLVAMSGGVDSSVAAYLLKKRGFEVIGLTFQLWPREESDDLENSAGFSGLSSIIEAKSVAAKLKIRHYVLDVRKLFKEKIIDNFCSEYQRGRTPNPCIRCNRYIKFAYLLRKAQKLGTEFIATGHYARIQYEDNEGKYRLKKGVDTQKDQSYVLYSLRQNQLGRILMPLGDYTKEAVRKKARALGLPVADRPGSQEICFVPGNDYRKFLKKWLPEVARTGRILNRRGEILGKHSGIAFYTTGQRKGLGISNKKALYVTAIDSRNNSITVDTAENLFRQELVAEEVTFIYRQKIPRDFAVKAKIRYLHKEAEAKLTFQGKDKVLVKFKKAQRAVTPGQAVVFYKGDTVVGGGIIRK